MTKRTDIRTALKAVCEGMDGITSVMTGRRRSIPAHKLPAICIYMESERKQRAYAGYPRLFERGSNYTFEIHIQASSTEAVEDLLDLYSAALETALLDDESLGGLVRDILPVMDDYDIEEDSKNPGGIAICRYTISRTG